MLSAIGFRAQAIVNSTSASTSWPLPRFAKTPPAGPITYASDPRARATKKRCDASSGDCPTSSTDNSATTQTTWRQAREDTRGRLYHPARPAQTPHTDALDKSLPGPTTSHPTTHGQRPLDTERRRLRNQLWQRLGVRDRLSKTRRDRYRPGSRRPADRRSGSVDAHRLGRQLQGQLDLRHRPLNEPAGTLFDPTTSPHTMVCDPTR